MEKSKLERRIYRRSWRCPPPQWLWQLGLIVPYWKHLQMDQTYHWHKICSLSPLIGWVWPNWLPWDGKNPRLIQDSFLIWAWRNKVSPALQFPPSRLTSDAENPTDLYVIVKNFILKSSLLFMIQKSVAFHFILHNRRSSPATTVPNYKQCVKKQVLCSD